MVHFNRPPAPNDGYSVAIQADNRKITQDTVKFLVDESKRLGGKYKACIMIGDLGDVNAIQRRDGFFDVVDKNKDIDRRRRPRLDRVERRQGVRRADQRAAGQPRHQLPRSPPPTS